MCKLLFFESFSAAYISCWQCFTHCCANVLWFEGEPMNINIKMLNVWVSGLGVRLPFLHIVSAKTFTFCPAARQIRESQTCDNQQLVCNSANWNAELSIFLQNKHDVYMCPCTVYSDVHYSLWLRTAASVDIWEFFGANLFQTEQFSERPVSITTCNTPLEFYG